MLQQITVSSRRTMTRGLLDQMPSCGSMRPWQTLARPIRHKLAHAAEDHWSFALAQFPGRLTSIRIKPLRPPCSTRIHFNAPSA